MKMKNLVGRLLLAAMLCMGGAAVFAQSHDAVADSVSIDDMAPILYDEEAEEEEGKSSTGLYVGVAIAIVVGGGVAYWGLSKKKK